MIAKFRSGWIYLKGILKAALLQGLTPRKLAVTIAMGIVLGIFPIFGTTTLLCLVVAYFLRLNIPMIQIINYLVTPLQLLFMIPFIKVGTYIFNLNPFPYSIDETLELFEKDFLLLLNKTGIALGIGIGVWGVVAIPLFIILFYVSFFILSRWQGLQRKKTDS